MKNYLLTMIIFVLATNFAVSGPFELFSQNDTVRGIADFMDLDAYAQIHNTSNETVDFTVSMEFLQITPGHVAALCYNICFIYTDLPFTAPETYSLEADSSSFFAQFSAHLRPYKLISDFPVEYSDPVPGTTVVRYTFKPVGGTTEDELHYDVVFVVDNKTSVEDELEISLGDIFPNPASDLVSLNLGTGLVAQAIVYIYDVNGNVVLEKLLNAGSSNESIDISALSQGTYFLRINNGNVIRTRKLNVVR